jgi:hypothetical protein
MIRPTRKMVFLFCALLLGTSSLQARSGKEENEKSCVHVAQAFYNWYVRRVFRGFKTSSGEATWHAALKYKGDLFSDDLTQALIKSDVEAKADGDPVLDFDPILNSQDPAERYVVRRVTRKGGSCWAEVYGDWTEPRIDQGKRPQVVAEMAFMNNHWQFVNFHYPDDSSTADVNLLSMLGLEYRPK